MLPEKKRDCRELTVAVRLNRQEKELLVAAAKMHGLGVFQFVRYILYETVFRVPSRFSTGKKS